MTNQELTHDSMRKLPCAVFKLLKYKARSHSSRMPETRMTQILNCLGEKMCETLPVNQESQKTGVV